MIRYLVALSIATLTMFATATAAEFGTKAEAVAMVKRVLEQFKKDGPEATFKAVSDKSTKEYHDRDLYPFIYFRDGDKKGLCVAHGARPVSSAILSLPKLASAYGIVPVTLNTPGLGGAFGLQSISAPVRGNVTVGGRMPTLT